MGESRPGGVVTSHFELEYLPDPADQRVRWALAFYREGLSLEHTNVAYATLSFFKILNIVANSGSKQRAWINRNFANFGATNYAKFGITNRLTELQRSGVSDIGDYLYGSIRCAVAHAGAEPTVDPENSDDLERLTKDLPLIRAMAAYLIERELHVKSAHTVWNEHLYELAGFKELLGPEESVRLKAKDDTLTPQDLRAFDRVGVGLRNHPTYLALKDLAVRTTSVSGGKIAVTACSDDHLIEIDLILNFPDERLEFDSDKGLRVADDGTERSAKQIISALQFVSDYIANGKLEVFNAATGALLGRKDAYLPRNILPGAAADYFDRLITKYENEAQSRVTKAE